MQGRTKTNILGEQFQGPRFCLGLTFYMKRENWITFSLRSLSLLQDPQALEFSCPSSNSSSSTSVSVFAQMNALWMLVVRDYKTIFHQVEPHL